MKVTGFPSGQWSICPLQIFTRSGRVITVMELALFETSAMSRAPAKALAVKMTKAKMKARTIAPSSQTKIR